MKRLGVVLAGGEASRLPNKPLLPIENGIVLGSALGFCLRSDCNEIAIITPPNGILEAVLHTSEAAWRNLNCIPQISPDGVGSAIKLAATRFIADEYLITFCDNIYDKTECVAGYVACEKPSASIRKVKKPYSNELDKYAHNSWVKKTYPTDMCLAGWYLLPREAALAALPFEQSVDYLNRIGAYPHEVSSNYKWWDIGTVPSYLAYLETM